MRITHHPEIDFLSIDFKDGIEAKSEYSNGVIVRYDKPGNVLGIDITDSMKLFAKSDLWSLIKACEFLGISPSTMRRRIKSRKIKFLLKGKTYKFRKADLVNQVTV